jgi:phage terminase large subunit-like protein
MMTDTSTTTAALGLLASLELETGSRWGDVAEPIQWADAQAVLDPNAETPYNFLTRARGRSKTSDLGGMAIAVMLEQLPPASRCYALAADRDQGRLLVESIAGYVRRTAGLGDALDVGAYRVTARRSGTTLDVLAADAPGAYGLRPSFLIVDELAQWATTPAPRQLWEAVTTAMAKIAGARMVVLTSAGDPAHWSYKVLEHARSDELWRTHEVPGPPPWIDGKRLAEQRRRLPESSYARLFLNQWTAAEDRLVNPDDLAACVSLPGPLDARPGVRYVVGVDLGLKNDRTVVSVVHGEEAPDLPEDAPARRVVLDRQIVFAGARARPVSLGAVEEAIAEACRTYAGAKVVADPWQAVGLCQRLRARDITVAEFTFSATSVGRLASTLHLLLRDRLLALPDDPELLDELANVRLRETSPGVLRMDHDAGRHDDRAISLALAAQEMLARPDAGVGSDWAPAVLAGDGAWSGGDDGYLTWLP